MTPFYAGHKDKPQPEGHWFPRSRVAKMFVYPFGVTAEQAPTTVVPGSHRLQGRGPKTTLTPGFVGQGQVEGLPHTAMPHALPVTVGPGSEFHLSFIVPSCLSQQSLYTNVGL